MVAGFFRVHLVGSGAPWVSLGSGSLVHQDASGGAMRVVGFFEVCRFLSERLMVRSGLCGSSGRALGVVRVRLDRPGRPLRYLGSFRFLWFVLVRPGGRWVCSGSHGPSVLGLGVSGLFKVPLVRSREP